MPTVTPFVPEQITVHLGTPSSNAPNVTVSFSDSVKNVASSEIYPTWDESALRANILAIVSFALNRVYTEFYRSRGYDYDITNSTAFDQYFVEGRSYFENISRLVDELFNDYLRRPGFVEPLAAKFCNGTTVTCEGLSQWGSEYLAQQGYNSDQIIRSYYGDVETVVNAPVRGNSPSYPGTPLRVGSSGPNVVVVQTELNRISQNYPAIPKVPTVDGIYGSRTEAAVRKFQEIFNLPPDGIVGKATWYALDRLYTAVTSLGELRSLGQQFYAINWSPPGGLQPGDTGEKVRLLQYMLSVLSEYIPEIPPVTIDGSYGSATRAAVLAAQRRFRLPETGTRYKIEFFLFKDKANLMIDLSGVPLHKRGYRPETVDAPIRETLAAAMVKLARPRENVLLWDPFCGSGTIAIEAAMMMRNIAPGLKRSFAAEQYPIFPADSWTQAREEAETKINRDTQFEAYATDINDDCVRIAEESAKRAGVADMISVFKMDALDIDTLGKRGTIVTNPPYGDRLLTIEEAESLYRAMGVAFARLEKWQIYVITQSEVVPKLYGRRADKIRKLYNGMIPCYYYQFFKNQDQKK